MPGIVLELHIYFLPYKSNVIELLFPFTVEETEVEPHDEVTPWALLLTARVTLFPKQISERQAVVSQTRGHGGLCAVCQ